MKTTKSSYRHRETDSGSSNIQKSKRACIVEAHESTRKRLEGTLLRDHEDHIAKKGFNSLSHHNLVHEFVATQGMGEARKMASVILVAQKEKESPLCHIDGHLSSQECGVGTKVSKVQRLGCAPR